MPNKKKMSEDELERRRIARREKYKQIKNDPEKYAAERAKKREAYLKRKESKKVKTINQMSPREQRLQRKKWRENSKRYHEKKLKEKKVQEVIVPQRTEIDYTADDKTGDPLDAPDTERQNNLKNKILLNKIKALKRKHLLEKKEMSCLIKKYQYRCGVLLRKINILKNNQGKENVDSKKTAINAAKEDNTKSNAVCPRRNYDLYRKCLRSRLQKKILEGGRSIQELVERFYEDDINSRNTAGKKQCIKKFGVTKQKRYLLDSVKKLHKKFMEENPNIRISYVTFARLRPFWVYLPKDDRDTCGCTVHTNMDLLISSLKKKGIVDINNFQNMLDIMCCDKYNLKCVSRKCQICKNKVIPYNEFSNDQEIEYYEWDRAKKKVGQKEINITKKFKRTTQIRNLILKLEDSLPKFFSHTANIINQYQIITELKKSLNDYEALVHMDFSENYTYKFAEEVQSLQFVLLRREEHEIREKEILLPKNIAPFKGTMLVHQVLWNSESEFLEFRKLSCYECVDTICKHDKHMQLHKIYKSAIESEIGNVKIIPPNKKIKILSDVTIKHANKPNKAQTTRIRKEQVTPLAKVKDTWQNQPFIVSRTEASGFGQHQQEFISFLTQHQESTTKD
uniref:SFRICE_018319 n=1 Tax=Spodoptera frugiperda TaxID=7108 RepID=A0A2H1WCE0_SPOFR